MSDPVIRYKGRGEFHNGIPARTLTKHEYEALDKEARAVVRESALYDYASYRDAMAITHPTETAKPSPTHKPKSAVVAKLNDTVHPAVGTPLATIKTPAR